MRKSLFLTLVLSLCVADFGAFAATARNGRSGGTTSTTNATQQAVTPVSARAGARQKVVSAPAMTSSASAPVSARAGARQKVVSAPATSAKTSASGNVAARAATKKAALSMGTKVAAATENTIVSQECQNAYYGCMDTFCMLDNATGGRCQCSDRSAELDAVMDEIMRIDEQSARLAAEGVEQIQMGEYADQVNNRASSVESGITTPKDSSAKNSSSSASKTLDLASLMNNNFFDVEEDTVFEEESERTAIDDIAGKTGDALQKAVAKICTAQVPAECKSSLGVLQTAYMSKIKSDCVGYENALKQQRNVSQQKLLTAQKSVRDAALDEVRKQNRYETAGECAVAFAQCMQTTAECGSDYTGCVTLAAADNLKASINDDNNNKSKSQNGNNNNNKGGTSNKTTASYTIKGVVSGADITIAASTMEALLAKKEICASVTKQCVNANKNDAVWNVFLRNAAPALKSAELIAEQNLRSNCLPTVAECFKTACKSQFGDNNDNYDMCLSNPDTYKSLCKVQLEPCLNATGGTYENPEESSLWNGLIAMLNSMKVDACTKEIKDCLLSEDRCGKDFSGCIGLDTYSIGRICPIEKLTACVTDGRFAKRTVGENGTPTVENEDEIRSYIAQIAQGLALNIDNNFATICQNAAEAALVKACGDGGSGDEDALCPNLDVTVGSLKGKMRISYQDKVNPKNYYDSVEEYVQKNDISVDNKNINKIFNLTPVILGRTDVYNIKYENGDIKYTGSKEQSDDDKEVLSEIQSKYNLFLGQIKEDPTVLYCMTGRQIEGFDGNKFGKQLDDKGNPINNGGRFPKLLDATQEQLALQILNSVFAAYSAEYNEAGEKLQDEYINLANRLKAYASDAEMDPINKKACEEYGGIHMTCDIGLANGYHCWKQRTVYKPRYNEETNMCVIERINYHCAGWDWWNGGETPELIERVCHRTGDPGPKYVQF